MRQSVCVTGSIRTLSVELIGSNEFLCWGGGLLWLGGLQGSCWAGSPKNTWIKSFINTTFPCPVKERLSAHAHTQTDRYTHTKPIPIPLIPSDHRRNHLSPRGVSTSQHFKLMKSWARNGTSSIFVMINRTNDGLVSIYLSFLAVNVRWETRQDHVSNWTFAFKV